MQCYLTFRADLPSQPATCSVLHESGRVRLPWPGTMGCNENGLIQHNAFLHDMQSVSKGMSSKFVTLEASFMVLHNRRE